MTPKLQAQFSNLDQLIRELVASAHKSLVLISPYLSSAGMLSLQEGMAASAERGAWIQLITGDLSEAQNRNRFAIDSLFKGVPGTLIRSRCRVLIGTSDLPVLLHAKIIGMDGKRGYLGSANLSFSGLEKNFELGVELGEIQTQSIYDLVGHLETTGYLKDCTSQI